MALTRDQILGAEDRTTVRVEVREWGGHAFLRPLSLAERVELESRKDGATPDAALALTVAFSLCDEQGARLFTEPADITALTQKSAAVLLKLGARVKRMNALTQQDIEDMAGNSAAAPPSSAPTPSPNG
ncbi:MAG: hypothetical protein HOQ26_01305 [Gemmatimonadaceae bacterium]|nr:hypothetical protein [Gemmatimonadaceae bacterium]NUQ91525.1 hypothetical protein [Gemmatimonadaceae bacterium]